MMHDFKALARAAYATYCGAVDFKAFNGDDLPTFDDVPERIQNAWIAAVSEVVDSVDRLREEETR